MFPSPLFYNGDPIHRYNGYLLDNKDFIIDGRLISLGQFTSIKTWYLLTFSGNGKPLDAEDFIWMAVGILVCSSNSFNRRSNCTSIIYKSYNIYFSSNFS